MNIYRLRHPIVMLSLVLLLVNDHILKGSIFSGMITGKLSDFSGLFFFPFFIADILQLDNRSLFDGMCFLTALVFTLLKISPEFHQAFIEVHQFLGFKAHVVLDRTDLFALMVLPAAAYAERRLFTKYAKAE